MKRVFSSTYRIVLKASPGVKKDQVRLVVPRAGRSCHRLADDGLELLGLSAARVAEVDLVVLAA